MGCYINWAKISRAFLLLYDLINGIGHSIVHRSSQDGHFYLSDIRYRCGKQCLVLKDS